MAATGVIAALKKRKKRKIKREEQEERIRQLEEEVKKQLRAHEKQDPLY